MSYLTIDTREVNGIPVLYVNGYLNSLLGEEIERVIQDLVNAGNRRVLLNFAGTRLINSIGISFIIGVVERLTERNGMIAFCALSPTNRELFQITGVTRYVKSFATEHEALAYLDRAI